MAKGKDWLEKLLTHAVAWLVFASAVVLATAVGCVVWSNYL